VHSSQRSRARRLPASDGRAPTSFRETGFLPVRPRHPYKPCRAPTICVRASAQGSRRRSDPCTHTLLPVRPSLFFSCKRRNERGVLPCAHMRVRWLRDSIQPCASILFSGAKAVVHPRRRGKARHDVLNPPCIWLVHSRRHRGNPKPIIEPCMRGKNA
jgi:hypothetical protein